MPEVAYVPDPRPSPPTTQPSRGFGSTRDQVLAARTYYVAASGGSDTFNGLTQGAPFATLQKAIDVIHGLDIAANVNVTIQLMDGNHTISAQVTARNYTGIGQVVIQGNTADSSKVTLTAGVASINMLVWIGTGGCRWVFQNVTLVGNSSNVAITLSNFARLTCSSLRFGAGFTQCFSVANESFLQCIGSTWEFFGAVTNAVFLVQRDCSVLWATACTVTLTGTPALNVFVSAIDHGTIRISSSLVVFSGSATGTRYSGSGGSLIQTNGGGANYLPGNGAGSVADTAQYL